MEWMNNIVSEQMKEAGRVLFVTGIVFDMLFFIFQC